MVDEACGACVMEVSSHALALRRVDGLQFAAGVFTNLTRDHLDFHGNMENYFAAKRRLFEMLPRDAPAVVNLDDPRGRGARRGVGRAGHLRHRQARRRHAGPARVLARRPGLRRADAAGRRARDVVARRPAERLQHPRRRRRHRGDRHSARRDRAGHRRPRRRAGPLRSGVAPERRHHGGRRLRAHRRRAAQPARDGAADGHAAARSPCSAPAASATAPSGR